jgi:hypothetical protein
MLTALTAHHEAGHAVAGIVRCMPLRYITLRPRTEGVLGRCMFRRGTYSDWDQAIQIHAGPIAGARLAWISEGRDGLSEEYVNGGRGDGQALEKLLANYENPADLFDKSQQQAHDLVMGHWDSVTAVAHALLERSTRAPIAHVSPRRSNPHVTHREPRT